MNDNKDVKSKEYEIDVTFEKIEEEIVEPNEIENNETNVDEINKNPKKKKLLKEVLDWVVSIVIAIIAVLLINQFVFVQVLVDGSSMVPTLHDGDRLFANRFLYEPEVDDIVVVEPYLTEGTVKGKLMFNKLLYIKRVIATEGQTIDIKDDKVYIDGVLKEEPFIADNVRTIRGSLTMPATIPAGHLFVMGDNRENSRDSRDSSVGILRDDQVVGKAVFRIMPFSDFGLVK